MQVQSPGRTPLVHFGEFRDSSARPPVRYDANGRLLGSISVHCEKRTADTSFCHHLTVSPSILPRSHWSCCGGSDRGSVYCCKTPHPGEYRDSSARPSVRYSSFCDYSGKIRLHCCTKDSPNEGRRCAHLDTLDKIITCSHWSCCGNTEKFSSSCLISADTKVADRQIHNGTTDGKFASSGTIILKKSKVQKLRPTSVTFDPEVDSEFTDDCGYEEKSESELSIEEYNDGPVVWSPFRGRNSSPKSDKTAAVHKNGLQDQLAVEAARLQLEIKSMYAYTQSEHSTAEGASLESARNLLELKLLELEGKFREMDSLKTSGHEKSTGPVLSSVLRPPSDSFEANFNGESAVVKASTARLQHIDELDKKLVRSGFNVDLSRVRSKLLNLSRGGLGSNEPSGVVSTPRPSVRLPEISDEPEAPSKVPSNCQCCSS